MSFRTFLDRDDASLQPGALQEVMLHETAVAWCRYKLARCLPARPWLETPEEYRTRLKAAVAEINATHMWTASARNCLHAWRSSVWRREDGWRSDSVALLVGEAPPAAGVY